VRRALALAGVVTITAAVSTGAVAYAAVLTAARVLGRRHTESA